MTSRRDAIAKLYEWRNRAYFRPQAWEDRGLIRSPDPIPFALDAAKKALVDDLLQAVFANADDARLIGIVVEHLAKGLGGPRFDTEEREFLGDCLFGIGASLGLSDFELLCDNLLSEKLRKRD